jgi:hypothetical protein
MLRNGQYDRFVVLFESLQLRTLAALSRSPSPECWNPEGRIHQLDSSVWKVLTANLTRRLGGWKLWFHAWGDVLLKPVRAKRG